MLQSKKCSNNGLDVKNRLDEPFDHLTKVLQALIFQFPVLGVAQLLESGSKTFIRLSTSMSPPASLGISGMRFDPCLAHGNNICKKKTCLSDKSDSPKVCRMAIPSNENLSPTSVKEILKSKSSKTKCMKHNEICHCDKNEHANWMGSQNHESIKSSSRESFTNSELKSFRFVASAKISWQPTAPSLHQPVTAVGFSTETKRQKSADPSGSEEEHEVLSWSRSCHVVKSHDSSFWKIEKSFFILSVSSVLKASELPTVIHVAKMGELMQKHGQHRTSTNELLTQGWSKISMTIFLIHGSVPQKRYVENRKKNLYTLYLQNSRIHNNSYEWITVLL